MQASSIRYSEFEGSGEIVDAYGVLDSDSLPVSGSSGTPGTDKQIPEPDVSTPSFNCPAIITPSDRNSLLHLLPLSLRPLPTIVAPPSCPGSDSAKRIYSLTEALNGIALGINRASEDNKNLILPPIGKHSVENVSLQQSLNASVEIDLSAVIDTNDTDNNNPTASSKPRKPAKGSISRIRFQSSKIMMLRDQWKANDVAFTNDPFTPANSWVYAKQVEAKLDQRTGVFQINARRSNIVLDQRISIPTITNAAVGEEQAGIVIDADQRDRNGVYLGYNLPLIKIGTKGKLQLQPQFLAQRAVAGRTDSYIQNGAGLGSPRINQAIKASDLFGLDALLDLPISGAKLNVDISASTFNPDNFVSGTRSTAQLSSPISFNAKNLAVLSLFSGYRQRVFNGSLGLQNLIWSYGARIASKNQVNLKTKSLIPNSPDIATAVSTTNQTFPHFSPLAFDWALESGNYQANLFESQELATIWRSNFNYKLSTTFHLWKGKSIYNGFTPEGLRFSPTPIIPRLGLDFGVTGSLNYYGDSSRQNALTLWGGPSLVLGHLEKNWLDYTRFSIVMGNTFRSGVSPFGFDRAVDLRTIGFSASQQIFGPIIIEGGATFNIDSDSPFFGETSYSYIEMKIRRRSYEVGVFYSPYEGIGGIRLTLNDFNFTGTGTPFVPQPATPSGLAGPLSQR